MKWFVILVAVLLLAGLVSGAVGECEASCGDKKNSELKVLRKMRSDLNACRPNLLQCVKGDARLATCRAEFSECKLGGAKKIKEKNIEINNNYNSCIDACAAEEPVVEKLSKKESSFCLSLKLNKNALVDYFGEEMVESVLKINGCIVEFSML